MNRRTFVKAAVIAAATPTVTALADTADRATLGHLIELRTLAYEADGAEWAKLFDLAPQAYGWRPRPNTLRKSNVARMQRQLSSTWRRQFSPTSFQRSMTC